MEVKDFLSLMWRHARILVAGLVLGAALGFFAVRIQTAVYEAKTQILISRARQQTNTDMLPLGENELVSTNVQLAKSQPVLDAVSEQLGSRVDIENISVAPVPNTLIIQIKVQDTDAERAAQIANLLVQVLIQQNEDLVAARYADFESNLNDQIDQLQLQIDDLQSQINQINAASISEQLAQVGQEIDKLQAEIDVLETEINAYPAFLNDKDRTALGLKQDQLEQLRSRLSLYQQIQTNLTFIGKPGQSGVSRDDPRLNSLQSTLDLYEQLYLGLVDSRETINLDRMQNTPNITQLDPAQPPKKPIRPLPPLYILLGTVVGFALAAALVLTIDHFDDTLRSSEKVREVLGVPIIGQISQAHSANHKSSPSSLAEQDHSALQNAFGSLRINVNRLMAQQAVKVLLITSPARGDGKTTIAENLAAAFVRAGKKVALIDADLYHPQLQRRLKLTNKKGLVDILEDGLEWTEVAQAFGGINIISSGAPSKLSGILLESDAMSRLLVDLQKDLDVVIIDGPPLFIMDAQILASKVGGIVLVVRQGDTLTSVAKSMLDQLHFMEANIFGAVLNGAPQKQTYYFDERLADLGKKPPDAPHPSESGDRANGGLPHETEKLDKASAAQE